MIGYTQVNSLCDDLLKAKICISQVLIVLL